MVASDTSTVCPAERDYGTDFPAFSRLLQLQFLIVTAAVYWSLSKKLILADFILYF